MPDILFLRGALALAIATCLLIDAAKQLYYEKRMEGIGDQMEVSPSSFPIRVYLKNTRSVKEEEEIVWALLSGRGGLILTSSFELSSDVEELPFKGVYLPL